ncbi:TolC family protein [Ulvibacterium marinum]|uniref:TolC family protein n=1 Tax=Ulvibacterium marinum TaxID=2419782 RepID=A0A3B0BV37_9FLAO|nr:TolC family protein [Ulvibacterium marinum]RKN76752.1 TolC family protein [Ulvibacterium marinum]
MNQLKLSLFLSSCFFSVSVLGQIQSNSIPLEEAYRWAEQHYPLIKDSDLIDKIEAINLNNIGKTGLPKISLNGQGQLQSENINIPIGDNAINAPLETFSAYVGIDYDLYDGGIKKAQKASEIASANVERKSLEVQLRSLKDRVNTIVFVIALSRKQKQILQTSKEDLEVNIQSLQAGFENGTVLESEVTKLMVRQLELTSEIIKTEGDIRTYVSLLEQLTGKTFPEDVQFELPYVVPTFQAEAINRPEELLFDNQKSLFAAQEASIAASTRPKISLFAQGGVGYPNPLDFSDISTATYALGGVKLKWDFLDWGKGKKERERIKLQQEQIEVDRELFLFDLDSDRLEYQEDMAALQVQIKNDEAIVSMQKDILTQSKVQLDNGVINSNDYVTQVNATLNAEQQLEFNKIQLQQTIINYLTLIGQL